MIVTFDSKQQQRGNRMRVCKKDGMVNDAKFQAMPRNGKLTQLSTLRHLFWVAVINLQWKDSRALFSICSRFFEIAVANID